MRIQKSPLLLLGLLCALLLAASNIAAEKPRLVIILDDIGYKAYYSEIFALPAKVTIAVFPGSPRTKEIMKKAQAKGFEVIGHIPMEALGGEGRHGINTQMSADKVSKELSGYIDSLPGIKGINNHMGSKVSIDKRTLIPIMQELKRRKMYIVDSRTNEKSIIPEVAKEYGVKCIRNDIFLDGDQRPEVIERKLRWLVIHPSVGTKQTHPGGRVKPTHPSIIGRQVSDGTPSQEGTVRVGIAHGTRKNTLTVLKKVMRKYQAKVDWVGAGEVFN